MKRVVAVVFGVFCGLANTSRAEIPFTAAVGHYEGTGTWKAAGQSPGTYTVSSDLQESPSGGISGPAGLFVKSDYVIMGMPMGDSYFIVQERSGFFKLVTSQGDERGSGYCFATHCHITMPDSKLEETIIFDGNQIHRFGSKTELGRLWAWDETLQHVN